MRLLLAAAVMASATLAPGAAAQVGDFWRVSGSISGRSFVLNCRLAQSGGICTDASKNGRSHPLTSVSVNGDQARWGFTTKVLLARIAMTFDGRIDGKRMSGVVRAAGRTGSFTGVRD